MTNSSFKHSSSHLSWSWLQLGCLVFLFCLLKATQLEGASVRSPQPVSPPSSNSNPAAAVPLGALVPHISKFDYSLQPNGNQYRLVTRDHIGGMRDELVELRPVSADDPTPALHVKGQSTNVYLKEGGILLVIYEAGPQGYTAKVVYETGKPIPQPQFPQFASASFLKTAAG